MPISKKISKQELLDDGWKVVWSAFAEGVVTTQVFEKEGRRITWDVETEKLVTAPDDYMFD